MGAHDILSSIVTIAPQSDRAIQIRKALESVGFQATVEGVSGAELPVHRFADLQCSSFEAYGRLLAPGELGCALSHLKVLESFLMSDSRFALVVEDDVDVANVSSDSMMSMAEALPPGFYLHLGHDGHDRLNRNLWWRYFSSLSGFPIWEVAPSSLRVLWGTSGYLVDRIAAQRVVDVVRIAVPLADSFEAYFRGSSVRVYTADVIRHPPIGTVSDLQSDRARASRASRRWRKPVGVYERFAWRWQRGLDLMNGFRPWWLG